MAWTLSSMQAIPWAEPRSPMTWPARIWEGRAPLPRLTSMGKVNKALAQQLFCKP